MEAHSAQTAAADDDGRHLEAERVLEVSSTERTDERTCRITTSK